MRKKMLKRSLIRKRRRRRTFSLGMGLGNGSSEKGDQDDLKAYNLDTYDDDEGGAESDTEPAELGIFSNVKGLSYYSSNEEDPYITLKDVSLPESPVTSFFLLFSVLTAGKRTIRR
jgi:hypothetical protein